MMLVIMICAYVLKPYVDLLNGCVQRDFQLMEKLGDVAKYEELIRLNGLLLKMCQLDFKKKGKKEILG